VSEVRPGVGLIDFEALDSLIGRVEDGSSDRAGECQYEIEQVCARRTRWQWVLHGATEAFRVGIVRHFCGQGKYKKAKRYACCGRGDTAYVEEHGPGCKVRPKCCGYRTCPRCSRRYGRKILRKVGGHLASGPHGAIDHVVLTQKVKDGESLDVTRSRFEKKWKRIYKGIRAAGMRSMLVTYHVKRTRGEGWHYHAHCVIEWGVEVCAEDACASVALGWRDALEGAGELSHPVFYRHVATPGDALVELAKDGQGEFWAESADAVTKLLQYCIRDVVQGIENWVEGVDTEELTAEFARAVDGAKLHRVYGVWRTKLEEKAVEEKDVVGVGATEKERAEAAKKGVFEWLKIGSVDAVLSGAGTGVTLMREFVRSLACTYSNRSAVCRRLTALLRSIGV